MGRVVAKQQILALFKRKDMWDYCEILSETDLESDLIMGICDGLEDEGILTILYDSDPQAANGYRRGGGTQHSNWVKVCN